MRGYKYGFMRKFVSYGVHNVVHTGVHNGVNNGVHTGVHNGVHIAHVCRLCPRVHRSLSRLFTRAA